MAKLDFILADTCEQAFIKGLDIVMQKAQNDKFGSYVILTPDSKTMVAEKYLLSLSDSGAFSNIYIYSLKRLLNKIAPVNGKQVLDKVAGTMIVKKIILAIKDNFVCYKKTATTNGFAEVMFETISQLKSSSVSVSDFYNMIDGVSASLKIKMQDIAYIYDEYQQFIENHYLDQSDLLTILSESVGSSEFIKNSHFYFFGYESVTNEALAVCEQILHNCKSFLVSASYLPQSNLNGHIADNEIFTKFKIIADKYGYEYNPIRITHNYNKDFLHIKNNLYAYPLKRTDGTNSVQILSAQNVKDEVDFVAQKIAEIIRNGASYKDIALIVPDLENYKDYIEESFAKNEFSYFIAKPYDYAEHPVFTLIKNYIEIKRKNYDKGAVISFLSNILLQKTNLISDFINYVDKYGINYNKFKVPFEKYDEKILTKEDFESIENLRVFLVDCMSYFDEGKTVLDYNNCIRNFLRAINIEGKVNYLIDLQEQDKVYQSISKQTLPKLDNVLGQMDTFLGKENISLDQYAAILLGGLETNDVSLIPISVDAINVSENGDGVYNMDYVFVLGAVEGAFPVKQQDCGVILDAEINELNEKSRFAIEPTIKTINRRERFKAYQIMLSANKQIILSYSEGAGELVNKPSNIILQLINMFSGENCLQIQKYNMKFANFSENTSKIYYKLSNKRKILDYICSQIGEKRSYNPYVNEELVSSAYNLIKNDISENVVSAIEKINKEENYMVDNADQLYFKDGKTSTSQLERYFTCPFLFFASYGLRLREKETSTLEVMDIGTILHEVAELFMQKLCKDNSLNVENTAKMIINNILTKKYIADDNKFLSKIIYDEAIRLCFNLKDEYLHSKFKPIGLEKPFGKGLDYPEVKINDKIGLEGKIDRIDKSGDRFRIIDYKTGRVTDNIKQVYYGKKLQLVTYLLAMQNSGLKPAAVVYYPIRNEYDTENKKTGKMKGFYLDDASVIKDMDTTLSNDKLTSDTLQIRLTKDKGDGHGVYRSQNLFNDKEFETITNYTIKLAQVAVEEILSGYSMPSPIRLSSSDKMPCEHCKYAGVCKLEQTHYKMGRKCYGDIKIADIKGAENE